MYATSEPELMIAEVETALRTIAVKGNALNCMTKEAPLWMKQAATDAISAAHATIDTYLPVIFAGAEDCGIDFVSFKTGVGHNVNYELVEGRWEGFVSFVH